jgi:NADH-quinone oxidoreductase subunit G
VSLDAGREPLEAAWGPIATGAGLDTHAMLKAAVAGEIDVLVLLGADPVGDFPDRSLALAALEACPFVVALATHPDDSTPFVDVVLPVAADGERAGTTTNLEGRVTALAAKVVPPSVVRAPWVIASEFASRLGADLGPESLEGLLDEIDRLAPAYVGIAAALSDQRIRHDGVVVPLQENGSAPLALIDPIATPGITSVGEQGAPMNVGSASALGGDETGSAAGGRVGTALIGFVASAVVVAPRLDAYSHRLVLSRRLYDGGTTTRTSPSLAGLAPASVLGVHPADLERLGVTDGDRLRLRSGKGDLEIEVRGEDALTSGVVALVHNVGDEATLLVCGDDLATDVRLETV